MKYFDYYEHQEGPPFGVVETRQYELKLRQELADDKSLTTEERYKRLQDIPRLAHDYSIKANEKYYAEDKRLEDEFYNDMREDLGYGKILTEDGCRELEAFARSYADSTELSDVFWMTSEVASLIVNLDGKRK